MAFTNGSLFLFWCLIDIHFMSSNWTIYGAEEKGNGIWNVYYRDVLLGWIDEKAIRNKETHLHIQRIKV